jgi:cytochrome c556
MRRWARFLSAAAGATVLLTVVVYAASPEDGQAAFQRREDTMKRMGRPLYLGIGRVVKGTAAYTAVNNACNGCHTEFRKEE